MTLTARSLAEVPYSASKNRAQPLNEANEADSIAYEAGEGEDAIPTEDMEASLELMGLSYQEASVPVVPVQPLENAPLLPLEDAVERIPEELRTAIKDYLQGEFREVRHWQGDRAR